MTVTDFLTSIDEYSGVTDKHGKFLTDALKSSTHVWSNAACDGYVVEAMQEAGFTDDDIDLTLRALYIVYDRRTVGEAEKIYYRWCGE